MPYAASARPSAWRSVTSAPRVRHVRGVLRGAPPSTRGRGPARIPRRAASAAEHHRRRRDGQLVHDSGLEALTDQVGATADRHGSVTGGSRALPAPRRSRRRTGTRSRGSGWSSMRWVTTNSGPGNGLVPPQAPAASYISRPKIAPPRPRRRRRSTPCPRRSCRRCRRLVGVGPRPADDPVVQPFAPRPRPGLGRRRRAGDVAVHRLGDGRDDLVHARTDPGGHRNSSVRPARARSSRGPRPR